MCRILLVEDDPIELKMYERLFTKEGFEVFVVTNGQDCLSAALYFHPDIILLDIMMPKMNGMDALNALRFNEQTKSISIIVQSNLSDGKYKDEALRRGAAKYLIKSQVENKDLVALVRSLITA